MTPAANTTTMKSHHSDRRYRVDQQHAWAMAGDPRGTYGAEIVTTEVNRTAAQRV
jgi:hypothetical protein